MNKLEEARIIINDVDEQMLILFKKRMQAVFQVAEYKLANNLPIFDEAREKSLIERQIKLLNDQSLEPYYLDFLKEILKSSKAYQKELIK